MKRLLSLALAVCMALCLASCGQKMPEPDTIVREDATIIRVSDGAKISLGMTREEVEKVLGEGTLVEEDPFRETNDRMYYEYENGLLVCYYKINAEVGQETIIDIVLEQRAKEIYKTYRGAQVGYSHEQMVELYGNLHFKIIDDMKDITINYACYDLKAKEYLDSAVENADALKIQFVYDENGNIRLIQIKVCL